MDGPSSSWKKFSKPTTTRLEFRSGILGWNPKYTELEAIIRTAWEWHQAHPEGYED
jgi:UDP-glucose 4-epimerase